MSTKAIAVAALVISAVNLLISYMQLQIMRQRVA